MNNTRCPRQASHVKKFRAVKIDKISQQDVKTASEVSNLTFLIERTCDS